MKKRLLILTFVLSCFMFSCKVNATTMLNCDSTVTVGEQITCEVTTDEEAYVSSSLNIASVSGENNRYSGKIATFTSNGSVAFETVAKGTYTISIETKGETYTDNTKVVVNEKTTSKTTTTTTTKAKSNNAYLSNIYIDGEEIEDFNKNTTKYYVSVENDVEKIRISADAEDLLATVDINGPDELEVGDNEFTIGVTSEDNTTKFYKVIVTRKEEGKSSDTKLKSIKVKGYDLNFDRDSKTFYLKIDEDVTKLNLDITTNDKNAKYEVTGNENLTNDSVIRIKVSAENGDTDTYRIIIQKEKQASSSLIIGITVLALIIIIIAVIVIIKKKNNKNKKNEKEEVEEQQDLEATKKMPPLSPETSDDVLPKIDNDEEEETRFLSYEEKEGLSKTKVHDFDDEIGNVIDEELEKTITFKNDENEKE